MFNCTYQFFGFELVALSINYLPGFLIIICLYSNVVLIIIDIKSIRVNALILIGAVHG